LIVAQRAKAKNAKNRWRQKEYLKIGTVMLPTLREERQTIEYLKKEGKA